MYTRHRLRKRVIAFILSVNIAVGAVVGLILYYLIPGAWFEWYPVIPVYFTLLGLVMSGVMYRLKVNHPEKIIHTYMTMRMVKLVVTVASLLIYDWLVGENKREFALLTICFYFLYLFIETYLFYRFEKASKRLNRIKK